MRALQGFASAPLECLVVQTVGDLSFLHERGVRLAIWATMIPVGVGAAWVPPPNEASLLLTFRRQVISGFVIHSLGVNATFGLCAIWFALLLPIVYFCVFETTYVRNKSQMPTKEFPNRAEDMSSKRGSLQVVSKEEQAIGGDARASEKESEFGGGNMKGETGSVEIKYFEEMDMEDASPGREAYRSRLRLFRGRIVDKPYWRGVWKPIPLIAYPAILFSTIVHG